MNSSLSYLADLVEADGEELGDTVGSHGDTIEKRGLFHGLAVMGDRDELGVVRELLEHLGEPPRVGLVEGGLDLIEHGKRRRIVRDDRKEERE